MKIKMASLLLLLLAAQTEDQFNVVKLGEPYCVYMEQGPALNLLAGIWAKLQSRKEP